LGTLEGVTSEVAQFQPEVTLDLEKFSEYQEAVFKSTEAYLESLTDDDLDKEIDMSAFGMGMRKLHSVLGGMIIGHTRDIMGEISVLKGIQGLKVIHFKDISILAFSSMF